MWCRSLCLQSFRLLWLSSVWSRGFMQEQIVMSGHWIAYNFCQWCLLPTHTWPSFLLILDVAPISLLTGALSYHHAQKLLISEWRRLLLFIMSFVISLVENLIIDAWKKSTKIKAGNIIWSCLSKSLFTQYGIVQIAIFPNFFNNTIIKENR